MRQTTKKAVEALLKNLSYKGENTVVRQGKMYLHGNLIAEKINNNLFIDTCGWLSNTTKERLNGLNGVSINQKNFKWYLNGQEWDGTKIKI